MEPSLRAAAMLMLGGCLLTGAHHAAWSQTSAASAKSGNQGEAPPANQAASEREEPVLQVTSVEVIRSAHDPVLDIVRARGLTSTGGWEGGELVPLTGAQSPDGIVDLVLTAHTPQDSLPATGFAPIEAILPLAPGHPFKGVRVHSATQSLTLRTLPGFVESRANLQDCSQCVGKIFVARGATAPAGERDVVKEDSLPDGTRIIRATDGVSDVDADPNRMTVLVGENGRISAVTWD